MTVFKRIICAMSGGVDSSVSAYLLKKKGFEVLGVYMRNWDIQDSDHCTADKDAEDAEYVCRKLEIPFKEVNFVKEYWTGVFTEFLDDYQSGYTPNPDILCNKKIKFDSFYSYAMKTLNGDAIATGHYANTSFGKNLEFYDESKNVHLLRGVDDIKDQTFFLNQVRQQPLKRTIFPIGHLKKSEVKKFAAESDFRHLAKKQESMGICFIGANNYQTFINEFIKPKPGNFIDIESGKMVGTHNGIHLWTIGQRCNIGGAKYSYYIAKKNLNTNDILVAPGTHHPFLYSSNFITAVPHWIHSKPFHKNQRFHCHMCFQHRNPLTPCIIHERLDGGLQVTLEVPLRALTPGQFAVLYDGNICLGGGKIISVGPSLYHLNEGLH